MIVKKRFQDELLGIARHRENIVKSLKLRGNAMQANQIR